MGKKKRIVLDTNNLIAALGWRGPSREVLNLVLTKKITLLICKEQILELERVMNYPKLKYTIPQKNTFLDLVKKTKRNVFKENSDDNFLLECAIDGKAEFVISGDKQVLMLRKYKNIKILTAKEFIETNYF